MKLKHKSRIERRLNSMMLSFGFSKAQTTNALKKAWIGYSISDKNNDRAASRYHRVKTT